MSVVVCEIHRFCWYLQAVNKTNGLEAALKQIPMDEVSDISDHVVEIEVLMECRHANVIGLLETFYHDNKLSVRILFTFSCLFFSDSHRMYTMSDKVSRLMFGNNFHKRGPIFKILSLHYL